MKTYTDKEIEELLRPRYEVIADYPLQVFGIGEIVKPKNPNSVCVNEGGYFSTDITKYPHLFKKLDWWQGLSEKDFPSFVKSRHNSNFVEKVVGYTESGSVMLEMNGWPCFAEDLLPATELEYSNRRFK